MLDDDEFRTSGSSDLRDYSAAPPEDGDAMAVKACHALRVDHGGVGILAHPSGRLYLLEANFPCFYAQSRLEAGVDVAGAMVDHLLTRAEALAPPSTEPVLQLVGSQVERARVKEREERAAHRSAGGARGLSSWPSWPAPPGCTSSPAPS